MAKARSGPKKGAGRRNSPPKKKKRSGKRRPSKRKTSGWKQGCLRLLVASCVGVVLAVGLVGWVLWLQALSVVDARLAGEVWSVPSRVLSGSSVLRVGMRVDSEDLEKDLRSAGLVEVERTLRAGEYSAMGDWWRWRTADDAYRAGVRIEKGRVQEVTGGDASVPPIVLATLTGPSAERRSPTTLEAIPDALEHAVLAMEDTYFYDHRGVSVRGVIRALFVNLRSGSSKQGASTLTQQLAKNLFLSPERTYARKARELLLSFALEERLTKDEILALYLNGIYLGQVGGKAIHGVAEAAQVYFGKPVERLELGEIATLVGIIPAPNGYSPIRHTERAKERRSIVLDRMVKVELVTAPVAEAAKKVALGVQPTAVGTQAAWGVPEVLAEAEAVWGEGAAAAAGRSVFSTLSPAVQRIAESAVAAGLAEVRERYPSAAEAEAAVVVLSPTGSVAALVGGRGNAAQGFHRAMRARRQIGSLVKPLTLLHAFDRDPRRGTMSVLTDEPVTLSVDGQEWTPQNYDGTTIGPVSIQDALAQSRNLPFVQLSQSLGFSTLQGFWQRLGLVGATALPASSLGAFEATPFEVARAYAAIAAGGRLSEVRIVTGFADPGEDPVSAHRELPTRVSTAASAEMVRMTMERALADGTVRSAARYGVTGSVAAKTGTTQGGRDAWVAGFTPDWVVVVWVGLDRGVLGLGGSQAALPIWARVVADLGRPSQGFVASGELISVPVCAETGLLAEPRCKIQEEGAFVAHGGPSSTCHVHGKGRAIEDAAHEGARIEANQKRRGLIQRLFGRGEDAD